MKFNKIQAESVEQNVGIFRSVDPVDQAEWILNS